MVEIYFKVTNERENHHGYQYMDGLNVLIEPFNDDPNQSCVNGGFYFTTKEHIHKFYHYGIYIRIIKLPTPYPEFKMIKDPDNDKWRANKIILCERYPLSDLKTYQILDIPMMSVVLASGNGFVEVLEWYKKSGFEFKYSPDAIDLAAENGRIDVLEWFKNSGLEFTYSHAIDKAARYGRIDVLEWFKNSGFEFKYSYSAIDNAARYGRIDVLEWFKNSDFEFKYSNLAIDNAAMNCHINILEWFKNSDFEFKYSKRIIDLAAENCHIDIVEWFANSGL